MVLEGNEVEKQLGEYGKLTVDLQPDLKLKIALEGHIDLLAELEKLAEKSGKQILKDAVSGIKGLMILLQK